MAEPAPAAPFARPDGKPLIIAHRGGSLEAPENTLAAVRHGIACGSDWQEVDVGLTLDDQAVILHDATLERTTRGCGAVADRSLAALAELRTGAPQWSLANRVRLATVGVTLPVFGSRYAHERIPTLQQVLALSGARLMLELKQTAKPRVMAATVVQAVHAAQMHQRVVVGSFDLATLAAVAALDPQLARLGILEEMSMVAPFLRLGVAGLAVDAALVPEVLGAVSKETAVWTWTIYTARAGRRMAAAGVHGLITDIPQQLVGDFRR